MVTSVTLIRLDSGKSFSTGAHRERRSLFYPRPVGYLVTQVIDVTRRKSSGGVVSSSMNPRFESSSGFADGLPGPRALATPTTLSQWVASLVASQLLDGRPSRVEVAYRPG